MPEGIAAISRKLRKPTIRSTVLLSACLGTAVIFCAELRAGEALHIAERGGFLLSHGYRCGAPVEQLEAPARLIHDLIDAASNNSDEKALAHQAWAERLFVSLVTLGAGDLLPSCPRVRRELARLKQHQPATANPEVSVDVERTHAQTRLEGRRHVWVNARASPQGGARSSQLSGAVNLNSDHKPTTVRTPSST